MPADRFLFAHGLLPHMLLLPRVLGGMRFLDLLSGHGRFPAPGLPRAFLPQWTLRVRAVQFHLIGVLGLLFLLFRFMAAEEVSKKSLLLFLLLCQLPLFLLAAGVTERAVFIGHGIVLPTVRALHRLTPQCNLFGFHFGFLLM